MSRNSNSVMARRTVGNFKRIMSFPCAITPLLAVEAAVPAVIAALWGIESPDPKHLYHKTFGRSALCEVKGKLQATGLVGDEHASKRTRLLFDLAEFIDLELWYLFLIDIAAEGLFNFSSNLIEYSGCDPKKALHGANSDLPFGACGADGSLHSLFEWANLGPGPGPSFGSGIVVPPGANWHMACSAAGQDVFGVPCPLQVQMVNVTRGTILDTHTGESYTDSTPDATFYHESVVFAEGANPSASYEVIECWGSNGLPMPDNEIFARSGTFYASYW
jgi:hypothetical protein